MLGLFAGAAAFNPWRLTVLGARSRFALLALAITCLLWAARSPSRRGWRSLIYWLVATVGVLAVLAFAVGVALLSIFTSDLRHQSIRIDDEHSLFVRDYQYSLGPDSACRQLELRVGSGLLERGREVGRCPQLKYVDQWTFRASGGSLTIDTGSGTCSYFVSDGLGPITAIDDLACRSHVGALK